MSNANKNAETYESGLVDELARALVATYGGDTDVFLEDAVVLAGLVGPGPFTVTPLPELDEFHTVYSVGGVTVGIGEGCHDEPALPELLHTLPGTGAVSTRQLARDGRWYR